MSKIAVLALIAFASTAVHAHPFRAILRLDANVQVPTEGKTFEGIVDVNVDMNSDNLPYHFVTIFNLDGNKVSSRCAIVKESTGAPIDNGEVLTFPLESQAALAKEGNVPGFKVPALNSTGRGAYVSCGGSAPGTAPFGLLVHIADKNTKVFFGGQQRGPTGPFESSADFALGQLGPWFTTAEFQFTVPTDVNESGQPKQHSCIVTQKRQLINPYTIKIGATKPWVPVYTEGDVVSIECGDD